MSDAAGQPLPKEQYRTKKRKRQIGFGQADVWNTVHESTEAYHEAHPDVTEKKRATHVCTAPGCWLVMKSYKKITKDGGIIWISV
jgi:hypothetical protein